VWYFLFQRVAPPLATALIKHGTDVPAHSAVSSVVSITLPVAGTYPMFVLRATLFGHYPGEKELTCYHLGLEMGLPVMKRTCLLLLGTHV